MSQQQPQLDYAVRPPRSARNIIRALLIVAVSIILVYALFDIYIVCERAARRSRTRRDMIGALRSVRSPAEAEAACHSFVPLQKGGWLAISGRETHTGTYFAPPWAIAIARDSDGNWFEGDHHSCAHFAFYGRWKRELHDRNAARREAGDAEVPITAKDFTGIHARLWLLESEGSLADAHALLLSNGFRSIPRP